MLRKWDGNADRPTSCLFFWTTGRARYLLSHLLYLIVHCAGAGWRGDCSSPEIPSGALPLVIPGTTSTQSHGHCQSVFSFVHSKTPLKGRGLHEKGTLDVFRKVLQHKAAYARSCTSVHNVSKEIICLGRCCFTWKHLPAARFHQRADLWIDFPSMTSSICRALQRAFISSALVRDWSDKMEQLTKRHSAPRHCPRSTASARMGQWQKQSHSAGARDCHRKCCEHRQWEWWCPALATAFPSLCFYGSPLMIWTQSPRFTPCQHSSPECGTRSAVPASTESWHSCLPFLSLLLGSPHARACFHAFLFYLQWCQRQPFDDLWPTEG